MLTILAKRAGFSVSAIARHLGISQTTASGYLVDFESTGGTCMFHPPRRKRKSDDPLLKDAVFSLLHEPPSLSGYNRTTWRMDDLQQALKARGFSACGTVIHTIIKDAGFRWRAARVVLTSNDPHYREKLEHVQAILSNLNEDEKFFSIDEFGPFAIKMKAGRVLVTSDVQPTVPQWQKSKGWLIATAALELSTNQVTHFYSRAKNTAEMIRMAGVLLDEYQMSKKLYLSWDAASWHMSKELLAFVEQHNSTCDGRLPILELAPLPASAQFLNVIESVFSGMARAIIHNSDYQSVKEAQDAIDRYFTERNEHYKLSPKRAGKKIWGLERTSVEFSGSNNCKDPAFR
ncbi:MAG: IS630 family transposase [Rhodoferax sp.]|nr:IS630 family transposase [Rhodoferax sp.]